MTSVRKQLSSEKSIIERLHTAIKQNDAETLAELLRFAPDFDRNLALNFRTYEAARLCGYDVDITFDRSGWLKDKNLEDRCEVIRHEGNGYSIELYVLQHPNGKWVAGHDIQFALSGSSSMPNIFCDQYDSRTEALNIEIDALIVYAERDKSVKGHKEAAAVLRKQKAELCQLNLFA